MKLSQFTQHFNTLKELKEIKNAKVECGISSNRSYWNSNQDYEPWAPVFKIETKETAALAKFWNITLNPVMCHVGQSNVGLNVKKAIEKNNCSFVSTVACQASGSSIKFKAQVLAFEFPSSIAISGPRDTVPQITPLLITGDPVELHENGHTYRLLSMAPHSLVMLVDEENPLFNYVDKNHIIVYLYTKAGTKIVITNQLNFETTLVLHALQGDPSKLEVLTAGVFLDHRFARQLLTRLEQSLIGPALQTYTDHKTTIVKDFQDNAQSLMVTKMLRGEVPHTIVNDITIKKNSVKYHNVSLETPSIEKLIANYGDLTEVDIYAIIAKFADEVEDHFLDLRDVTPAKNIIIKGKPNATPTETATLTKTVDCAINEIPITITNSGGQRKINGIRVNQAELSKVIQMAACHRSVESYNRFLAEVSRFSLRCASALAEGLFVQICSVGGSDWDRGRSLKLTKSHPKLEFVRENGEIMLKLNATSLIKIYRFAGLVNSIDNINSTATGQYTRNPDRIPPNMRGTHVAILRSYPWVLAWVKHFLVEHTRKNSSLPVNAEVNDSGFTEFENYIRRAQKEAVERSKKLLERVLAQTKTTVFNYKGKEGYKVVGKLREYFVAAEDNKVYNLLDNSYVCIVDDARHSGVGADPLCARLLALRNDSVMAEVVTTLAIKTGEKLLEPA